jgi:hypothetical protein
MYFVITNNLGCLFGNVGIQLIFTKLSTFLGFNFSCFLLYQIKNLASRHTANLDWKKNVKTIREDFTWKIILSFFASKNLHFDATFWWKIWRHDILSIDTSSATISSTAQFLTTNQYEIGYLIYNIISFTLLKVLYSPYKHA